MLRSMRCLASAATLVIGLGWMGMAVAQNQEGKELEKLEGYDSLPGEKGVKKALTGGAQQPVETMIVWSEAKPTSGAAPLTVQFTADAPTGAKAPAYTWDFGDGSAPVQAQSGSHTYTKAGIYKAILTVTDGPSGFGMDEQRIKVTQ